MAESQAQTLRVNKKNRPEKRPFGQSPLSSAGAARESRLSCQTINADSANDFDRDQRNVPPGVKRIERVNYIAWRGEFNVAVARFFSHR
jgi:hypothetical protein